MLRDSQQLESFLRNLDSKFALERWKGETSPALEQLQALKETVKLYRERLQVLVGSERSDIHELEKEFETQIFITSGKIREVTEGSLRIELHGTCQIRSKFFYKGCILAFDHDILVARVPLQHMNHGVVQVSRSDALIRGFAYVQRTLEIMLLSHMIHIHLCVN